MRDLDKLLSEPYKAKIKGKVYSIEDPGIELMLKLVRSNEALQRNELDAEEFFNTIRQAVPNIPDKVYNALTITQIVTMFNDIGAHFMSPKGVAQKDPLSGRSRKKGKKT